MTHHPADAFAEFYGELCDAAARVLYGVPDDDPWLHTSAPARAIALRVLDVLEKRDLYHPPLDELVP